MSRGYFAWGVIVWGYMSGVFCQGGICPGGICPDTLPPLCYQELEDIRRKYIYLKHYGVIHYKKRGELEVRLPYRYHAYVVYI